MSPYLPEAPPQPIEFYQVSLIPLDDVNPDLLRTHLDAAVRALEDRADAELVGMDWGTLQIRTEKKVAVFAKSESHLAVIATVQALP